MLTTVLVLASTVVPLDPKGFTPMKIGDLPQTVFKADGEALKLEVAKSASFLLLPYKEARTVKVMRFEWKSEGALKVKDHDAEQTKAGDDSRLRVGLLVAGDAPTIPVMAPSWLKDVREHMKLDAGRLFFVVAGSKAKQGAVWESPRSSDISLMVPSDDALPGGWHKSEITFSPPVSVVGLWLMADGDDTGSTFTTWLRKLTLD